MGDGVGGGVVRQGLRRQRQEGPQQPGRVGTSAQRPGLPHPPEPCRTRAPDEVQEHGLGVVPGVVGGADGEKAPVPGGFFQEGVACLPGRLLPGEPPVPGQGGHVPLPQEKGDAPALAPVPDEVRVPAGGRTQMVVKMGGGDGKVSLRGQEMQQTHGILPAGDRAEHPAPLRQMPPEGVRSGAQGLIPHRHSGYPGWRTACTPASTAAPPCRSRRGGFSPRCTRRCCASPSPRYSSRPGRGT